MKQSWLRIPSTQRPENIIARYWASAAGRPDDSN